MFDRTVPALSAYYDRTALALRPFVEPPYVFWVIAAVVGLGAVLYLAHRYRRTHRPIVPFRAEGGDVEIAPQTIRGLINGTVKSVPGVKAATSRYEQRGRQFRLRIFIHLQASAKLMEVQHEIKRRIRLALHSHIGMEPKDITPIRIKVTKIIGEPDPRNTATLALPSTTRPHSQSPADEDLTVDDSETQNVEDERDQPRT